MIKKYLHTAPGVLFVLFVAFFFVYVTGIQHPISWDALGYYLYLPTTFLYNDVPMDNLELYEQMIKKYDLSSTFYQVNRTTTGNFINKYPMGMAICYAPFYFLGDFIALITDSERDGFSKAYQLSLQLGGFVYTVLSVIMIYKILCRFYSKDIVGIVTGALLFGTNYLITVLAGNSMPHNMLFLFYGILIWGTIKWHDSHRTKYMIFIALSSGILILSRPTEIVALLIPLLWNVTNFESLRKKVSLLKSHKTQILLLFFILLSFGIPQFTYWKILAGKFIVTDYGNPAEGFDFLTPHVFEVLFSFRKGWFIYTPIMLVATIGFIFLRKNNKALFTPLFIFFIFNLYLVSSWSCWWYAASFSCRALVQSSLVMLFPLAELTRYFFDSGKKHIIVGILSLFVALNLFQSWQLDQGILDTSRMTRAYYFKTFGALEKNQEYEQLLLVNRNTTGSDDKLPESTKLVKTLHYDFESLEHPDDNNKYTGFKSNYGDYVNDQKAFTKAIKIPYSSITDKQHAWLEINYKIQPTYDCKAEPFSIITAFDYQGKNYKYRGRNSEDFKGKVGEWNSEKIIYLTPEVRTTDDLFVFYLWNRGKQLVRIDEIYINIYESR